MNDLAIIHETTGTWGALPFLTINESDFGMAKLKNTKLILLTQGKFTIVDTDDFDWLNQWKWGLYSNEKRGRIYAIRTIFIHPDGTRFKTSLRMHRIIMNAPIDMQVDHINGDGLDNRRCNLRICTNKENASNKKHRAGGSSKFKGICWHKAVGKWYAYINNKSIGYYTSEIDAAKAYNKAALKYHGEFARLNII